MVCVVLPTFTHGGGGMGGGGACVGVNAYVGVW